MSKEKIDALLSSSRVVSLTEELSQIIDVKSLSYPIEFTALDYFSLDENLKPIEFLPKEEYIIEGNLNSKELIVPIGVYKTSQIFQQNRPSLAKYLNLLNLMGVKKVFFKPFLNIYGCLTLFQTNANGGVIIQIVDIK